MSRGRAVAILAPAAILIALTGGWEIGARVFGVEDYLLPTPSEIATTLWEDRALFGPDLWVTFREVVLGFVLALVTGVGWAVAMHLSPALRRAFYPLIVASQTIPIVAIAPVLVIWFGFGIAPILIVIALVCFFPVCVNTLDGLRSVDPAAITLMRTLDASRLQVLTRLEGPAALPHLFTGAKIAIAVAVIGAIFGEFASSGSGLGHLMQQANSQFLTARVFGAVFLLAVMAIVLFGLVSLLERRFARWGPTEL